MESMSSLVSTQLPVITTKLIFIEAIFSRTEAKSLRLHQLSKALKSSEMFLAKKANSKFTPVQQVTYEQRIWSITILKWTRQALRFIFSFLPTVKK